jgi:hypothetical protein
LIPGPANDGGGIQVNQIISTTHVGTSRGLPLKEKGAASLSVPVQGIREAVISGDL